MTSAYFVVLLLLGIGVKLSFEISCKNENNEDIDWFIVYKLPKLSENSSPLIADGSAYAYITSQDLKSWTLSSNRIENENSILGNTWKGMKTNEKSSTYLFYNDEGPKNYNGSAVGHLKGFFSFNGDSGFWLIHTIPKFGVISKYGYPKSGLKYGQYAFCVTYKTSQLNSICNHLLYCNPYIYEYRTSEDVLSQLGKKAKTLFTDKPDFIHSPPFLRVSDLQGIDGQIYKTFAKDNQLVQDLYSKIIAPHLSTSLMPETWRRGSYLPPACEGDFTVNDITAINLTATHDCCETKSTYFKSTEDHNKWAVSQNQNGNWICLADLNRMKSQEKRGGGAVCFQSPLIWKSFFSIISDSEKCPT